MASRREQLLERGRIANELPNTAIVSASGLTLKEDGIHFNSESLREFGKRYFEVYKTLKG